MPDYLKKGLEQSIEVMEALEVLSSLGDFENFKATMIAKKKQMNETCGSGNLTLK